MKIKTAVLCLLVCVPFLSCASISSFLSPDTKPEGKEVHRLAKTEDKNESAAPAVKRDAPKMKPAPAVKIKYAIKTSWIGLSGARTVTVHHAKIRQLPSEKSPVVATPKKGDRVKVLKLANEWCLVETGGGCIGWGRKYLFK
jgi:hypothetical protein